MNSRVPREWERFEYFDPVVVLPILRNLREFLSTTDTQKKFKALRTNSLKRSREFWDAAVFCHLLSRTLGWHIYFSHEEHSDYDSIFTWNDGNTQHFAPIQLKELVPTDTNPAATLQEILDSLSKYSGVNDLIVGIKLNRKVSIDFSVLNTLNLHNHVREVWMFGATTESQSHWCLFGELLSSQVYQFDYELPHV